MLPARGNQNKYLGHAVMSTRSAINPQSELNVALNKLKLAQMRWEILWVSMMVMGFIEQKNTASGAGAGRR